MDKDQHNKEMNLEVFKQVFEFGKLFFSTAAIIIGGAIIGILNALEKFSNGDKLHVFNIMKILDIAAICLLIAIGFAYFSQYAYAHDPKFDKDCKPCINGFHWSSIIFSVFSILLLTSVGLYFCIVF